MDSAELSGRRRMYRLLALTLTPALALLVACAPFGGATPLPPSQTDLATVTAYAAATYAASSGGTPSLVSLPPLHADPGWVAVVQVADGAQLGGPEVSGDPPGASTGSATMTLGYFTLTPAALVTVSFACVSAPGVTASVEISVGGGSSTIQCGSTATSGHFQLGLMPSDAGKRLTVTATISTNATPPEWNLLVEQPK